MPQTIAEFVADRCNSLFRQFSFCFQFLFILPGLHEVKQRNRSGRNNRGRALEYEISNSTQPILTLTQIDTTSMRKARHLFEGGVYLSKIGKLGSVPVLRTWRLECLQRLVLKYLEATFK